MRKYDDKDFIQILRHIATYFDVYKAVRADRISPEGLKRLLMDNLNKPESTARAYVKALKHDYQGLFSYNPEKDVIFLGKESVYDFFCNMKDFLCWKEFGFRDEYIRKLESELKDLKIENYKLKMYINSRMKPKGGTDGKR
ncbi:MAG: hypothetical protein K6F00_09320 [Lachnospiraceae bacterium]|nr:hypothetical protein [Lachnospiraceae bacterium]